MVHSLPSEWSLQRLDALCRIRSGGTPPKNEPSLWAGTFPWVSGKDLKSHRLSDSVDHITHEAAETFSEVAPAGSVLALVRGMGLVNSFAVSLIERPMAFNQDLKALIPQSDVLGAFLVHALTFAGQRMLQNVSDAAHGTKRLSQDDLRAFELPIPPLAQQAAIANVLDCAVAAIDAERRCHAKTEQCKAAAMRELFTRGLRAEAQKETEIGVLPSSWEVVGLGSLGRIGNGSTPKKSNPHYWTGGTYPWLTSAKVYDREVSSAAQFVTPTALDECHLPRLKPGCVLVAITGQGKTLGHCAVLRMEATINQHLAYVDTNPALADPSFVRGYLETRYEYLRQIASGGGSTKGALTCAFLRGLKIPLPPLEEQKEIVAVLDAIDQKTDIHKKKRVILDDLFKALLYKLMTGEIRVSDLDLSALQVGQSVEAPS